MLTLIILVLVALDLVVNLFGLYAIHRNKDAWSYGAQKLNQAEQAVASKVDNVAKTP